MTEFSIIIPVLNEEQTIGDCLAALQPWRNKIEIIVVDGGSMDGTKALAEGAADKVVNSGKGRAKQMNAGAQYTNGDVLLFLHADTRLPATALDDISESVNATKQWGRFDVSLTGNHPMLTIISFCMNWRSRLTGIATGDQAIFVTRNLFDEVGQFPDIALMEDIALSKKLKRHSPPICLKSKALSSGRRWLKFGIAKTIIMMWWLRLLYFFGADPDKLAARYYRGD